MLVPLKRTMPGACSALGTVERMSTPGATRSGLVVNVCVGPRELKSAIVSVTSSPDTPTVTGPSASAARRSSAASGSTNTATRRSKRPSSPEPAANSWATGPPPPGRCISRATAPRFSRSNAISVGGNGAVISTALPSTSTPWPSPLPMSTSSTSRSSCGGLADGSQRTGRRSSVRGSSIRMAGTVTSLVEAPTASTPGACAGAPTVPSDGPSLPAAATTVTPASAAVCAAVVSGPSGGSTPPRLRLITSASSLTAVSTPASTSECSP